MQHYDVVGIGIPYFDIIVQVPAAELQRLGISAGGAEALPTAVGEALALQYGAVQMCGGPVSNTLTGMAALGLTCGHIGALGADVAGDATRANLCRRGIDQLYKTAPGMRTPVIHVLVTPDGERSFIFAINSGEDIRQDFLPEKLEIISGMFYSQLKFLGRGGLVSLFEAPFTTARQRGAEIVYGLQSFNRDSAYAAELHRLVTKTASIVIGNDEEMIEFMAGGDHPDIMLVRTRGRHGVEIIHQGKVLAMPPPEPATDIMDTIGAGDQFAAGFLTGVHRKLPPERCAAIGFKAAAKILRQTGGQPPVGTDWRALAL